MIPEEYKELVNLLVKRTHEGKINWQASGQGSMAVYFDDFSLVIRQDNDWNDNQPGVNIALYDTSGKWMDGFFVPAEEGDFGVVEPLFNMARRKALRIDEALSRILGKLKSDENVGGDPPPQSMTQPDDDLPF